MSETAIIPEETTLEAPETPTPEEATPTETSPAPKARDDKRGNDRNKSRRDRGGMREEEKEFREEMLSIDRVTRVTTGGRQLRFRASIVIGDGKGRVGLGIGKSNEVQ